MEWAIDGLSVCCNLARFTNGAAGPEREREIGRSESVTASIEMRSQKLGGRR
jgi:hypothetical protein